MQCNNLSHQANKYTQINMSRHRKKKGGAIHNIATCSQFKYDSGAVLKFIISFLFYIPSISCLFPFPLLHYTEKQNVIKGRQMPTLNRIV